MNTPAFAASYAHGGGGPPLQGTTVSGVLEAAAGRWPDADALVVVDQGIRWSWRELRDRAQRLGAGLLASGLRPGERIGVLAPNRAEWLLAHFKIPRYVRFVDSFPMTVTGKVQKFVLREQLTEELGLGKSNSTKTGV